MLAVDVKANNALAWDRIAFNREFVTKFNYMLGAIRISIPVVSMPPNKLISSVCRGGSHMRLPNVYCTAGHFAVWSQDERLFNPACCNAEAKVGLNWFKCANDTPPQTRKNGVPPIIAQVDSGWRTKT